MPRREPKPQELQNSSPRGNFWKQRRKLGLLTIDYYIVGFTLLLSPFKTLLNLATTSPQKDNLVACLSVLDTQSSPFYKNSVFVVLTGLLYVLRQNTHPYRGSVYETGKF